MDPTYPLYAIVTCISFVLALVPLAWHLEAWNSATCYYMLWASLACLNKFANSVIWSNNAINSAPAWCDISTRIIIGASVGIPAASFCINRRLYLIARMGAATVTRAEKRRAVLVDTLICVFLPILCMIFAFIVQGHRFNIYEEIGCYPSIYNAIAAYFLVNSWPVALGVGSAVYCILSLRAFAQRRAQFREFLSASNPSLTFGRYFRLMALATTELLFTIPVTSYAIYLNATTQPIEPWVSWSYVHYEFSRVQLVPSVIWRMDRQLVVALELGQWLNPLCALVFFAYFGLAEEARRHYKAAFWAVARRLGVQPRERSRKQPLGSSFGNFSKTDPFASVGAPPAYSPSVSFPTRKSFSSMCASTERDDEKITVYEMMHSPEPDGGKLPPSPSSSSSSTFASPTEATLYSPAIPSFDAVRKPGVDSSHSSV
ncbi:hypothetical protein EVJ58_g7331 [Rhodofomes roseus]|uniref:Pheromone receptor n=1 Tax=Rhodofomes roseus TaxID=34475 RepID=A0A4Y9Y7X4_9APHY|nr:hypothetical protein EVJ58_g7331 [Rhodofomes roseus]